MAGAGARRGWAIEPSGRGRSPLGWAMLMISDDRPSPPLSFVKCVDGGIARTHVHEAKASPTAVGTDG